MVTRERYEQGMDYEAFLAAMPEEYRHFFKTNYEDMEFNAADLTVFRALPDDMRCLALAEHWCHDTGYNLPILARIAEAIPIDLRIFPRDAHLDIMDMYLKEGKYRSLPVFVFFQGAENEALREVYRWTERPAAAVKAMQGTTLEERNRLRDENRAAWRNEVIREIREGLANVYLNGAQND